MAGINQDQCGVGRGGTGDHVSRVLHMARCVSYDEFPYGCGKVPVGHINGDALLAFVLEPVSEQAEVNAFQAFSLGGFLDRFHLIDVNAFAVVEQTPNQG